MAKFVTVIPERLAEFMAGERTLDQGGHNDADGKVCLLEAVAYIAGEPHSDRPDCVSPAIAAFGRRVNDWMTDAERSEFLLPLLPKLIGARNGQDTERRIGYLFADYAVRVFAPFAAEAVGRADEAATLRALAPIVDRDSALAARPEILKVNAILREHAGQKRAAVAYAAANAANAAYAAAVDAAYAVAAANAANAAYAAAVDAAYAVDAVAAANAADAVAAANAADAVAAAVAAANAADAVAAANAAAAAKNYRQQLCAAAREALERAIGIAAEAVADK